MGKQLKLFIPFSRSYLAEVYGVARKEVQVLIEDDIIYNFILRLCRNSEVSQVVIYSNDLVRCRDIQSSKLSFAKRESTSEMIKSRRELELVGRRIFNNKMFAQVNPLFPLLRIESIRSVLDVSESSNCNCFMGSSGITLKYEGAHLVQQDNNHFMDYGAVTAYGKVTEKCQWKCFSEHLSIETLNLILQC